MRSETSPFPADQKKATFFVFFLGEGVMFCWISPAKGSQPFPDSHEIKGRPSE